MCFFRENLISSILPTTLYLSDNVHRQMDNLWHKTAADGDELMNQYEQSRLSREEALICTNLDLCEKYGLAFYRGKTKNKLEVVYKP